jgi:hypothetical protein
VGGPSAARSRKMNNQVEQGKTIGTRWQILEKEDMGNVTGQYYTVLYCVTSYNL